MTGGAGVAVGWGRGRAPGTCTAALHQSTEANAYAEMQMHRINQNCKNQLSNTQHCAHVQQGHDAEGGGGAGAVHAEASDGGEGAPVLTTRPLLMFFCIGNTTVGPETMEEEGAPVLNNT